MRRWSGLLPALSGWVALDQNKSVEMSVVNSAVAVVGVTCRVYNHVNERNLADACGGFSVATGYSLVIQRLFLGAEIREGVDHTRRLLHVIEFIGRERIVKSTLGSDFGKPLVIDEKIIMLFRGYVHAPLALISTSLASTDLSSLATEEEVEVASASRAAWEIRTESAIVADGADGFCSGDDELGISAAKKVAEVD